MNPGSPIMTSFKDAIEKESKINERMTSFGCAKCTKPTARSCLWSVGVLIFFMAQVISIFCGSFFNLIFA